MFSRTFSGRQIVEIIHLKGSSQNTDHNILDFYVSVCVCMCVDTVCCGRVHQRLAGRGGFMRAHPVLLSHRRRDSVLVESGPAQDLSGFRFLAVPLSSCMTSGKSLRFPVPRFLLYQWSQ